jgi:Flp pilus assembly protein TadD
VRLEAARRALAHYALGHVLMVLGECHQAEASLREALRLDPGFFEAHSELGVNPAKVGNREDAHAEFRTAMRIRPDDPQVKANLAVLLADRAAEVQNIGPTGDPALR